MTTNLPAVRCAIVGAAYSVQAAKMLLDPAEAGGLRDMLLTQLDALHQILDGLHARMQAEADVKASASTLMKIAEKSRPSRGKGKVIGQGLKAKVTR